jgi:hypothetical protein
MATVADGLTDEIQNNLVELFTKMDAVREWTGGPLIVHCCFRPQKYNELVKGAKNSQHTIGKAIDFHAENISVSDFHKKIMVEGSDNKNMLEIWNMRCERGTVGWVHLDDKQIIPPEARFFNP